MYGLNLFLKKEIPTFRIILGALLTYNQTCSSSSQCDSTKGLSCNNSICVCDTTKYWESNLKDCRMRN
jgi:hypothetical protein